MLLLPPALPVGSALGALCQPAISTATPTLKPTLESATMPGMRIEQFDSGTAVYLTLREGARLARSTFADELVTLDWDEAGNLIGVEVVCSPKQNPEMEKAEG